MHTATNAPILVLGIRQQPFTLPEEIIREYGEFTISEHDSRAAKVEVFTLEDVTLISIDEHDYITGKKAREKIIEDGYVPLNAYCAAALFKNKTATKELEDMWCKRYLWIGSPYQLRSINFFGSMLQDTGLKNRDHVLCFNYEYSLSAVGKVSLLPFEADDVGWGSKSDFALVFTEKFAVQHGLLN